MPGSPAQREDIGADCGVLVETSEKLQPPAVAKRLKALADREQPQLIILGQQAIDDYNQTRQMLAALLGWGQATVYACRNRHHRPTPERAALHPPA